MSEWGRGRIVAFGYGDSHIFTFSPSHSLSEGPVAQLDTCLPAGREQLTNAKHKIMKFYVYVLKSETHFRFYVGMTQRLEERLKEHNSGKTKSTKGYGPWKLFFFEECSSRLEARMREKYLKSGAGKEYIKDEWSRSSVG